MSANVLYIALILKIINIIITHSMTSTRLILTYANYNVCIYTILIVY